MSIKLDVQYQKLKEIALRANISWHDFSGGGRYLGPVKPIGIYIRTHRHHKYVDFWFVLAEQVPPQDLNEEWDETSPGGFIIASLDNDFEFAEWDSSSQTLLVYGECSPDGTLSGKCEEYAHNPNTNASMALLFFEHQGNGYTGMLMQKR